MIDDTGTFGGGGIAIAIAGLAGDSTIRDNAALNTTGGGIMNIDTQSRPNPPAILRVIRSTVVGNVAGDPARVSLNEGVGGGVAHHLLLGDDPNDGTTIVNSTIAYNVAFTGSQLYGSATVAPLRIANALVARDGAVGNCASPFGETGIDSFGGNISSDASPCFFDDARDQVNLEPGLDSMLADNGGPTQTIALLDGSPAIGEARPEPCPAIDQRSFPRNESCDVGAYEFAPEAGAAALALAATAGLAVLRRTRRDRV